MIFEVWAPGKTVTLRLGDRDYPMEPDEDGWCRVDVRSPSDADYGFLLPGQEKPLPDPRSGAI